MSTFSLIRAPLLFDNYPSLPTFLDYKYAFVNIFPYHHKLPDSGLFSALATVFVDFAAAMIIVDPTQGYNVSEPLLSVPLTFDATPIKFEPLSGYLVLANLTEGWLAENAVVVNRSDFKLIIVDLYTYRPYLENRLLSYHHKYHPAAVIVFGGMFAQVLAER